MKHLYLPLWIILFIGYVHPSFATSVVNKIVAKVDNEVITQADVDQARKDFEQKLAVIKDPAEKEHYRKENQGKILEHLINEKILDAELTKSKVELLEEEVDEALQTMAHRQKLTMEELKNTFSQKGISPEKLRSGIREDLKKNKFLQKTIYPRIKIAESDIQDYFQKHVHEFNSFSEIRFLEIFLTPDQAPPGEKLEEFAQKIMAKINNGSNFQTMAKQYSRGAFTSNGGDSGVLSTKEMRPDLVGLLINLPIGKISGPFSTSQGTFIFKVLEKKSPRPMAYNEVRERVRQKLFESRVKDELDRFLMEVRSRHYIDKM